MKSKTKEYKIPEGGSLGLLALGDVGLIKWREKRAQVKEGKKKLKKEIKKKNESKNS